MRVWLACDMILDVDVGRCRSSCGDVAAWSFCFVSSAALLVSCCDQSPRQEGVIGVGSSEWTFLGSSMGSRPVSHRVPHPRLRAHSYVRREVLIRSRVAFEQVVLGVWR